MGRSTNRAALVQRNKPYKKSVKSSGTKKPHPAPPRVIEGKLARRQHKLAIRESKMAARRLKAVNTDVSAPRLLAFLPLTDSVDFGAFAEKLLKFIYLDLVKNKRIASSEVADKAYSAALADLLSGAVVRVPLPAWAPGGDFVQLVLARPAGALAPAQLSQQAITESVLFALDICKAADIVVPVYGEVTPENAGFDRFSNEFVSLLHKQGAPAVVGAAVNKGSLSNASRSFETCFGKACRFFDLSFTKREESRKDLSQFINFVRHTAAMAVTSLDWREGVRGYGLVNRNDVLVSKGGAVQLNCFVRGLGVSVKTPLHITGVGDFAVVRIESVGMNCKTGEFDEPTLVDELVQKELYARAWEALNAGSNGAESGNEMIVSEAADENCEESTDDDGASSDELGSESEKEASVGCAESTVFDGRSSCAGTDPYFDEDVDARVPGDLQPRSRAEMEFDDEVDTPNNEPARERFAKYRGLKSLKNSVWEPLAQDQLPYAAKLYQMKPYRKTRDAVIRHYLESLRVTRVRAREVLTRGRKCHAYRLTLSLEFDSAEERAAKLQMLQASLAAPTILFSTLSLLERKTSVQHFSMVRFGDCSESLVPKKSQILLQCGFRRHALMQPLFSVPTTKRTSVELKHASNEKLLSTRYLRRGTKTTSIFTSVGPIHLFHDPSIAWFISLRRDDKSENFNQKLADEVENFVAAPLSEAIAPTPFHALAHGRFLTTDPDRLILKRIVLTGYPHKIHGRKATVVRMFTNRADVAFFAAVALHTKRGRNGKIREPIGIHGSMKCFFDHPTDHGDTVCLTLYKRHLPKFAPPPFVDNH